MSDQAEIGMCDGGQDDGDGIGAVAFQAARIGVQVVVQFLDGLLHLFAVFLAHRDAVDDLGYSAQRDPCLLGHILHSRGGVLFYHAVHSFACETFLYQADISQADISKGILLHSLLF